VRFFCSAGCSTIRVPVGPRDFQIEDGWQETEAGGQGGAAAGPLATQTFTDGPHQVEPPVRAPSVGLNLDSERAQHRRKYGAGRSCGQDSCSETPEARKYVPQF